VREGAGAYLVADPVSMAKVALDAQDRSHLVYMQHYVASALSPLV